MCLSTAWEIDASGVRVKICEHVSTVKVLGGAVMLTDLMGDEITVTGILQSIDLVKNDILILKTATVTAGVSPERGGEARRYERIREIFNRCSGNQMRDVDIEEIDCIDIDADVRNYCIGEKVSCDRLVQNERVTVFDLETDGVAQRITYTLID